MERRATFTVIRFGWFATQLLLFTTLVVGAAVLFGVPPNKAPFGFVVVLGLITFFSLSLMIGFTRVHGFSEDLRRLGGWRMLLPWTKIDY